jgi:pyruvate dehydrogenase E2 component (dihydrolipoamide acetyltransferase)
MEAVLAARARLNENLAAGSGETRITLNDFIVRAAALALRDVPAANLRRLRNGGNGGNGGNRGDEGDGVESVEAIDVAVVAATETGPVTLILRDADRKGLAVLSQEIRSLAAQARAGVSPEPSDSPGTIAITSFARFGVESAHPMLPREQICLLGVGTVIEEPVVQDGAVIVGSTLSLTLAFDPGAVGGAVAAQLLGTIRGHLEDPLGMML